MFTAGIPHKDRAIIAGDISEDGLETVKNQGRQDIRNRWQDIENYWVEVIRRQSGDDSIQWVMPTEHLSYQMPKPPYELFEEDFVAVLMDYELFKREILSKDFKEGIANKILYQSHAFEEVDKFMLTIPKESNYEKN